VGRSSFSQQLPVTVPEILSPPLVSVVVTTFNGAEYVADGLKSIMDQTFTDYEVVVVDDASSDTTCQVVERTLQGGCRFHLERLSSNSGGPAGPRNHGIRLARGRWIALLDSDDIWHPDKLETQLAVAAETGPRFVPSEKRWFQDVGETTARATESLRGRQHVLRRVTHHQLRRKNFLCTSSVMGERGLFLRHPFPPDRDYRAVEDYRCWLDIHRESVAWHPQIQTPLVFYRVSASANAGCKLGMVRKHWRLYRDYFRGQRWGGVQVLASMTTYGFASLYRQFKYRQTRC